MTYSSLSRRDAVKLVGGAVFVAVAASCRGGSDAGSAPGPDPAGALGDPMHYSSVRSLASAIRDRRTSSVEVVDACLARIAAVNPALHAVVQLRADEAEVWQIVSRIRSLYEKTPLPAPDDALLTRFACSLPPGRASARAELRRSLLSTACARNLRRRPGK